MTKTFEERIAAIALADDAESLNRAVADMERIRILLGQFTGREPGIPPLGVMNEVYDLMHRVFSPGGSSGRGAIESGPEYPTLWLPEPMVAQLNARGALHVGGIAAGMLACASIACMGSRLLVERTRKVLPTLWVPSIGDAGCGKTPAHEIVFAPLKERENRASKNYAREMRHWAGLEKKDRKDIPKPVNDTRTTSDATIEVLARRLNTESSAVAFVADELSGMLKSIGQYKKEAGADKGRFLSLWSGEPWQYERVGSGEDPIFIHVEQPIMPIFGTIQPEFVSLLGDTGSGMQARWLPHLCGEREGTATGRLAPEWESAVNAMLAEIDTGRTWTLDAGSDAMTEFTDAEVRWNAERKDPIQTSASDKFLAKAGEHALRVALIHAEIDAAGRAAQAGGRMQSGALPAQFVRSGIALVDYCAAVWRSMPNVEAGMARSYADKAVVERDGVLNAWLRGRGDKMASRREILRAKVAGARTYPDVDALIARHKDVYGDDAVGVEPKRGAVAYAR